MLLHQNSQKRYCNENLIYFITTDTYKRFPYFKEKIFCELFIEDLRICKKLKRFRLYAFCLNYDHLHLLLKPGEEFNISKVMFSLKKQFSHDANRVMGINDLFYHYKNDNERGRNDNNNEGGQTFVRLQQRFIHSHQKHIRQLRHQFLQKYGENQIQIPKFGWQKSFRDHIIRNEKDLQNHYRYTAYNYTKHNLPNNWKYTSLNFEDMVDGLIS